MGNEIIPKISFRSDDVSIIIEKTEKFSHTMDERIANFNSGFEKRIIKECSPTEIERFNDPDNYMAFFEVGRYIVRYNSTEKKNILESILIQKIKSEQTESNALAFNSAIRLASELTAEKIRLLVFIETISPLLSSALIDCEPVKNADSLYSYLRDTYSFSLDDIKDCEHKGLIYSTFPKELDISGLTKNNTSFFDGMRILTDFVLELLGRQENVELGILSYSLSRVGNIIANTQINLIGTEYSTQHEFGLKYSDFKAQNIVAGGGIFSGGIGDLRTE
jgi:hypothetical protein